MKTTTTKTPAQPVPVARKISLMYGLYAVDADGREIVFHREDHAMQFAAAPETAAERDRLKASNAELRAALELMLHAFDFGQKASDDSAIGKARAAIAKAKGQD